jgi:hypothetical protein
VAEKRKWFDAKRSPKPQLRPVEAFQDYSEIEPEMLLMFSDWVATQKKQQMVLFQALINLQPVYRLNRNLKVVLGLLAEGSDSLYDGEETKQLAYLSAKGLSQELQDVAYTLLNTYERYQIKQATEGLYKRARARSPGCFAPSRRVHRPGPVNRSTEAPGEDNPPVQDQ